MNSRRWFFVALIALLIIGAFVAIRIPQSVSSVSVSPIKHSAPALPAPHVVPATPQEPRVYDLPKPDKKTMPLARMLRDGQPLKLNAEQLARYLQDSRGSAEALLTVSRLTGNLESLRQAARTFPNDPQVQLELAMRGETAEERRQALNAFRQADPENALGDYLSALDNFYQGKPDAAVQDLLQSDSHTQLDDHALQMLQSSEEAYLSAGYSAGEAKVAAMLGFEPRQAKPLMELSKVMSDLQRQYTQQGDTESAQAVVQIGLALAQKQQSGSNFLIDNLVGMAIEKRFLSQVPSATVIGANGQTASERLAAIQASKEELQRITGGMDVLLSSLNENEAVAYLDRQKLYGELEALRWLKQKRGQ
jgi:hypothetical protein